MQIDNRTKTADMILWAKLFPLICWEVNPEFVIVDQN